MYQARAIAFNAAHEHVAINEVVNDHSLYSAVIFALDALRMNVEGCDKDLHVETIEISAGKIR